MTNFRLGSHVAQQSRRDKLRVQQNPNIQDFSNVNNPSAKASDAHNPSYWKGLGSQQSWHWIMNHVNESCSLSDAAGIFPDTVKESGISLSSLNLKPGLNVYQDVPSSLTNPSREVSSQDRDKQYREMQFSSLFDQNTPQGLSLSLSSQGPSEMHGAQLGESCGFENLQFQTNVFYGCGDSVQGNLSSSTGARSSISPPGPFTGYATILMTSKFLKPAQQLLNGICNLTLPKIAENDIGTSCGGTGFSSLNYSSKEAVCEGRVRNGSYQSYCSEFQQRKAKLLYMQEEVCRRYKQYNQQLQMVVSSFQSVAGLTAATPYTSLALKTVSKHFRYLKMVIFDHLRRMSRALGEDSSFPTMGESNDKDDTRIRFIHPSLPKHKSGRDRLGFLEHQKHVWRPQRGLPEHSVAILKAWLFEHFLHPYPSDIDKDMLATQTGLSRSQVSNWFINARVRVWKPMVEEIHLLESKGYAARKNDGKPSISGPMGDQQHNFTIDAMPGKRSECLRVGSMQINEDGWSCEMSNGKRSRMECQFPIGLDGSLMGSLPYNQTGLEIGGFGAVSLTLGLRNTTEIAQQEQEHQLITDIGGQMIHDFGD